MAAADVLILASYREGFGSVIIEANACGVPAVAYRIDGVIDAVLDGKTGLLVETGNVAALSVAMSKLAGEPQLRETLGDAAHHRALVHFSSKAVTSLWVEFYKQF